MNVVRLGRLIDKKKSIFVKKEVCYEKTFVVFGGNVEFVLAEIV